MPPWRAKQFWELICISKYFLGNIRTRNRKVQDVQVWKEGPRYKQVLWWDFTNYCHHTHWIINPDNQLKNFHTELFLKDPIETFPEKASYLLRGKRKKPPKVLLEEHTTQKYNSLWGFYQHWQNCICPMIELSGNIIYNKRKTAQVKNWPATKRGNLLVVATTTLHSTV